MIGKKRQRQPRANPASKPGRHPCYTHVTRQHAIELAIAVGMTVDQICTAVEMLRRTASHRVHSGSRRGWCRRRPIQREA